jgi:hypothetical protein
MSVTPTPPQPIPPKVPLMLRVRDDLLVAVIIILAITSAICTGVIATVMVIDRVARPAAAVPETPRKPDVPVPAKPVTPEKPVTPSGPQPFNPIPPASPPAPATPLAAAAVKYRDTFAEQYASLRDRLNKGKKGEEGGIKNIADLSAAARANAAPMAGEMLKAAKAHADADGNFTDFDGMMAALDQVVQSLGGK